MLCERMAGERRVALTPEAAQTLVSDGHSVVVESGAGVAAGMPDDAYLTVGATVAPDLAATVGDAGVVVSVNGPTDGATLGHLGAGHILVGLFDPFWLPDVAARVAATGATMLALDLVPRSTRAQAVDVLSSMATVEGFQSVLLAAGRLPKMLPMLMTAAGTVPPARVLVLGAGVAGLQAIATARRLGAVVEGFDIREEALEQIRSLGAKSIDPPPAPDGGVPDAVLIHEVLAPHVAEADIVIATAQIPGRQSPLLVTAAMVAGMRPGSVLVDLAVQRGGNCEVSIADSDVDHGGVTVLAPTNLASGSTVTASRMFATNITNLVRMLDNDGEAFVDPDDDVLAGMLVAAGGQVVHPVVRSLLEQRAEASVSDGKAGA
ncbi:MAG: NAD(P) transhydrogenase subunit alpha [Acidimicrobiales bacterium]